MRLLWRVFLANALVLTAATVLLAVSPATVSSPIGPVQAAVLAGGLIVMLACNLLLLRRAFEPFESLVRFVGSVDPLAPGGRVPPAGAGRDVVSVGEAIDDMLERLETERRDSARRLVAAQEEERRRVARDLHDEVGQLLTAALLQLDLLETTVAPQQRELAGRTRETIDEAHRAVRDVVRRLRPLALDDLGLERALAALASAFERDARLAVRCDLDPRASGTLSAEEDLVVYRVAQEALTNAARHSRGTSVALALTADDEAIVLRVDDDGRAPAAPGDGDGYDSGSGVRGMRERALLIGASLSVGSLPGGGTRVEMRMPRRGAARWGLTTTAAHRADSHDGAG